MAVSELVLWLGATSYNILYGLGVFFTVPLGEWSGTYTFINPITQEASSIDFVGGAISDVVTGFIPAFASLTILDLVFYIFVCALVLVIIARIIALFL